MGEGAHLSGEEALRREVVEQEGGREGEREGERGVGKGGLEDKGTKALTTLLSRPGVLLSSPSIAVTLLRRPWVLL